MPCVNECRLIYRESLQKEPPPSIWVAKNAFTPIIFRTKNTEKSRLGRLEKISEKICGKMFRGKEKAPNLVERGQGVLKYERLVQRYQNYS